MDILGQSSLLVAVTSFGLGASVLTRNARNKLFLAFAVLANLISGWALFFFLEKMWGGGGFYRWHLFFNLWLAPAGLVFIQTLVRLQDKLSRRLLDVTIIAAIALTAGLVLEFERERWVLQLIYFFPGALVMQILRLMYLDIHSWHLPAQRSVRVPVVGLTRRNLIYLGGLLVLSTSVMDHMPWLGQVVPALGNLALTAYLFFLSQAVSQQRLLTFWALFSRFLVLLAFALMLTVVYSMLFAWIENRPALFFLNSFIVSFLLLTLLEPIRSVVAYLTQRLLSPQYRRLQQALDEAQRKLIGIIDPGTLFQSLMQTVELTLQPEASAIFVLRSDATKYRRVRTTGQEPTALREILANHPLLEYCARLERRGELPVLLDQILENEIDRSASRTQRDQLKILIQGLKALEANLLIPLMDSDKILGFITLRAPAPPEPWGTNWGVLPVIYPYFQQAAKTLRSMDVYVRAREKERLAALGEMAAGLAHEIRNPLGAIKGAVQCLESYDDAHPDSRFLKIIVEEVERLNRVVTQFLDYSKPPATELKPVDVSLLAEKTVSLMRTSVGPLGTGPGGSVHLEFRPSLTQAQVLAAPEQIQQVLINLIQNSVKALNARSSQRDASPPVIKVSVEAEGSGAAGEVFLVVEDNGPGIRREHLEKLFIPFFTTSPSGTGLGLSISQKIIEAHRGRIEVATEEGRFARFSVILPRYVK